MFKNYLKTAFRNLFRNKIFSFINIGGLAIGIASCLLIFLYIITEFSYDKFHEKSDRIYRVAINGEISGSFFNVAVSSAAMARPMIRDFPEVVDAVRINDVAQTVYFTYNDKKYFEEGMIYVDSSFFNIFTYDVLNGDLSSALDEPYSLVLTEDVADKYFGKENPIGKIIKLNDRQNYKVTAVIANPPQNAHFHFKIVSSFSSLYKDYGKEAYEHWGSLSLLTYILLNNGVKAADFEKKLPDFFLKYMEDLENMDVKFEAFLQPITSIHLHSNLMAEAEANGSMSYIYTFSAIAIFILLIACINYMNLTTARSIKRSREVGLRKVVGALKKQLIFQFIFESMILSLIGFIIALILVEISLPVFNELTGQEFGLNLLSKWYYILSMIGMILFVGLVSGSYPAFYLSSFHPIKVIKGGLSKSSGKSSLRNTLVIVQFTISIILIICTGVVYSQLQYIKSKKLGFDKENILILPLRGERLRNKIDVIKSELLNLSCVEKVTASRSVIGSGIDGTGYHPEGYDENSPWIIFTNSVDEDYVETMGMNLIKGRGFSKEFGTDTSSIIINKTLMKKLGWEEPLGKKINRYGDSTEIPLTIIGVIDDFHFNSLHKAVEPSLLCYYPEELRFLNLKLNSGNINTSLETIKAKWNELEKSFPFDYYFLDQDFENFYRADKRMGEIFIYFTIIAIFVACLGLFGLASYSAEQKTKEIGIRKAIGSSVSGIVFMLTKQFVKWILIANIIAWPIAYFYMDKWLGNFAYNIELSDFWWLFVASAVISFAIAVITVSSQALRAATANPVESLKYE
ncbi:MAG: ABC transporter permease [Bacteroidales bacterium]|nr:ABC transporter permease [Bacteroidales bacterium]